MVGVTCRPMLREWTPSTEKETSTAWSEFLIDNFAPSKTDLQVINITTGEDQENTSFIFAIQVILYGRIDICKDNCPYFHGIGEILNWEKALMILDSLKTVLRLR